MVQKTTRPDGKTVRSGLFGSGLTPMDLFVILATSVTFLVAFTSIMPTATARVRPST